MAGESSPKLNTLPSIPEVVQSNKTIIVAVPDRLRSPDEPKYQILSPFSVLKKLPDEMSFEDFLKTVTSYTGKDDSDANHDEEDREQNDEQLSKQRSEKPKRVRRGMSKRLPIVKGQYRPKLPLPPPPLPATAQSPLLATPTFIPESRQHLPFAPHGHRVQMLEPAVSDDVYMGWNFDTGYWDANMVPMHDYHRASFTQIPPNRQFPHGYRGNRNYRGSRRNR